MGTFVGCGMGNVSQTAPGTHVSQIGRLVGVGMAQRVAVGIGTSVMVALASTTITVKAIEPVLADVLGVDIGDGKSDLALPIRAPNRNAAATEMHSAANHNAVGKLPCALVVSI
jgi:hypothetical protein